MGERTDLPKIKPDEQPSIFNHSMAKWAWISGIASGIVALPIFISSMIKSTAKHIKADGFNEAELAKDTLHGTKKLIGFVAAAQIVGAIVGGLTGKQKQEKEQIEGRVVRTPSYWNTGIISGAMVSSLIQSPFYFARFEENLKNPRFRPVAALIAMGSIIGGSIYRKNQLQRDFDKAVEIQNNNNAKTQQLMQAVAATQQATTVPEADAVSFKNTVTPDEAVALAEKQAQAPAPTVEKPAHDQHHGSHAAKHEHHQHTGSHTDKHEATASHTDHAAKPEAGMAMGAA